MDIKQVIETLCDAIEDITISTRTRKNKENQPTESDTFKFPNEPKDRWYKYEQITADHRFDCDKLREAPNALSLLCDGITSTAIIDDQKIGRALSVDAFGKKYNDSDGVTIDLFDALSKKVSEVKPEAVTKQATRLSKEQALALQKKLMAQHGFTLEDLK